MTAVTSGDLRIEGGPPELRAENVRFETGFPAGNTNQASEDVDVTGTLISAAHNICTGVVRCEMLRFAVCRSYRHGQSVAAEQLDETSYGSQVWLNFTTDTRKRSSDADCHRRRLHRKIDTASDAPSRIDTITEHICTRK